MAHRSMRPIRGDTRGELAPREALHLRDQAQYAVHAANQCLAQRGWADASYSPARHAIDKLMLFLIKGKWQLGTSVGTHEAFTVTGARATGVAEAMDHFRYVIHRAAEIEAALLRNEIPPRPSRADIEPQTRGGEVLWADDVPLTPTSSPVVTLSGPNREMGRQYARQILEIYGEFILAWHARRPLNAAHRDEIGRWERELLRHTPQVHAFAQGLAEGARSSGIAMDDEHAIAMFTGLKPPAREARPFALAQTDEQEDSLVAAYLGFDEKRAQREVPSPCSGAMAWGSACGRAGTIAGASSTDHDCTFQATIVAYPDKGYPFIWTPYSANGSIPVLGHFFFGGHPGINSQGLAYVHHNGATMGEPKREWGYGVRRGAVVMHVLQFCRSAKEALDFMLRLPVGDAGISQGTAGGMFADATYGFSLEARRGSPDHPQPINRECTTDRQGRRYELLYGTNNALAPESGHLNAAPQSGKGYDYSLEGGWYTFDPALINAGTPGESIKRRITKNSEGRNRFFHKHLIALAGSLDIDRFTELYRTSGSIPPGPFNEVCERYHRGEQWDCAPGHRANALVAMFEAGPDADPIYRGCVGPLSRHIHCRDPGHGYYYFDETNVPWELRLAPQIEGLLAQARARADLRIGNARQALAALPEAHAGRAQFEAWLSAATEHRHVAERLRSEASIGMDDRMSAISRELWQLHWAQVRAGQIADAVWPPNALESPPG